MELEILKETIANIKKIDKDSINENTDFKNDLKCDSIELFSIIMAMEEKYGKEIPNEKLENIKTVGDAVEAIKAIL